MLYTFFPSFAYYYLDARILSSIIMKNLSSFLALIALSATVVSGRALSLGNSNLQPRSGHPARDTVSEIYHRSPRKNKDKDLANGFASVNAEGNVR